jgi:hypothetical protein
MFKVKEKQMKPIEKDTYNDETFFTYEDKDYIVQFETIMDEAPDTWEPVHGAIGYRSFLAVDVDQMAVYTMDGKFVEDFSKLYETAADAAQDGLS